MVINVGCKRRGNGECHAAGASEPSSRRFVFGVGVCRDRREKRKALCRRSEPRQEVGGILTSRTPHGIASDICRCGMASGGRRSPRRGGRAQRLHPDSGRVIPEAGEGCSRLDQNLEESTRSTSISTPRTTIAPRRREPWRDRSLPCRPPSWRILHCGSGPGGLRARCYPFGEKARRPSQPS